MKKLAVNTKYLVWLLISFVAGIVAIVDEIEELLVLPEQFNLVSESYLLFGFQILFFMLFALLLIGFTIEWRPRRLMHFKQLLSALIILAVGFVIVNLFVTPIIEKVNHSIVEANSSANLQLLEANQHLRHLHEPHIAWWTDLCIVVGLIYVFGRIYLLALKKREAEVKLSELEYLSVQSRLNSLYNQLNPHFFFNSLNALHGLVMEGRTEHSLQYIQNMSNVFRYILKSEQFTLVRLSDELDFLETYSYMLKVRYSQNLVFDIDIPQSCMSARLPVLSLLPLVENVMKHNEISSRNKMTVSIKFKESALSVANIKHPRIDYVDSNGSGLCKLNERFELLMQGKGIIINDSDELFEVILPLLGDK